MAGTTESTWLCNTFPYGGGAEHEKCNLVHVHVVIVDIRIKITCVNTIFGTSRQLGENIAFRCHEEQLHSTFLSSPPDRTDEVVPESIVYLMSVDNYARR